ncbi:MAG: Rrf2 family transcriptional regulator [Oscillospiraceae bacterium]
MRINTRFPVATHTLAVIALTQGRPCTSELIAKSVNTNPVVVRRIISQLKKAGLVQVLPAAGGTRLVRAPEGITLLDIYNAVKTIEDAALFDVHPNPNPKCYIGANIHKALESPLATAQQAMEEQLGQVSLAEVMAPIAEAGPRVQAG